MKNKQTQNPKQKTTPTFMQAPHLAHENESGRDCFHTGAAQWPTRKMRSGRLAETAGRDELGINRPQLIGVTRRRAALLGLGFDPITLDSARLADSVVGRRGEGGGGVAERPPVLCPRAGCKLFGVTTRLVARAITALTEAISYHVYGMRRQRLRRRL